MQVSKWGNSLAIRIPNVVVETLQLKEGDEVEVTVVGTRHLAVERDRRREKALETVRRLARPFPPGWKFDRDDANERETAQQDRLRIGRPHGRRQVG